MNPAIPVAKYGALNLVSDHVDEQFMLSNVGATVAFGQALADYCRWYADHATGAGQGDTRPAAATPPLPTSAQVNGDWELTSDENNAPAILRRFDDAAGARFIVLISMQRNVTVWITVRPQRADAAFGPGIIPDPASLVLDGATALSCATLMNDFDSQPESGPYPPVQRHDGALSFQITLSHQHPGADLRILALAGASQYVLRLVLASGERCDLELRIQNFRDLIGQLLARLRLAQAAEAEAT